MKTTQTIRIEVSLAPDAALEQLARYSKDWRESRLPREVRGTSVSVRVQGNRVELELRHINGEDVIWRGSVVKANGRGSLVTLAAEHKRGFLIWMRLGIPLLAGYGLYLGGLAWALVGLVLGLVLALVVAPTSWAWRAKREAPICRAIVLRAMQWTPEPNRS